MALRPCTGPATATRARSSAPCTSPRTSPARGARYRRNEGSVVSGRWSAIGLALITDHRPPTTPPMVLYLFGRVTGIVVVFLIVSVLAFFLRHPRPRAPEHLGRLRRPVHFYSGHHCAQLRHRPVVAARPRRRLGLAPHWRLAERLERRSANCHHAGHHAGTRAVGAG